ncbi:MAG: ADP-ribosylglycohydrolase family protein [Firmicutes bacterium]|nr:ADP-ribosylglycohydrolase family protein [Bacillota bacterium]
MPSLFEKIYGCLAASNIASAMGAVVEGWETDQIVQKYGVFQQLLPYSHYKNFGRPGSGRLRPAGTTEDGIERQRLMCTAIIEKRGRITADDLAKVWLRDINPDYFGVQMEPCDEILYNLVKAGIPPADAGRYSNFLGIVSFARSCHPIGLINACNPEQAVRDAWDVGRLYQPLHGYGLDWSAVYVAAIAEALKQDATVDSVISKALEFAPAPVRREIEEGLDMAARSKDVFAMREPFNKRYSGRGTTYAMSMAHEVVTKGLAIFYITKGMPKDAIVGAVNFGRDTDCTAAVASGLAGALNGVSGIPEEWIRTVDEATLVNDYTVSRRTLRETAQGIYEAVKAEMKKAREWAEEIERGIISGESV